MKKPKNKTLISLLCVMATSTTFSETIYNALIHRDFVVTTYTPEIVEPVEPVEPGELALNNYGFSDLKCSNHCLAIRGDELYAVGLNSQGQLGIPEAAGINPNIWRIVEGMRGTTEIFVGLYNSFVIKDGEMYVTGDNQHGQLGLGHTDPINTFTLLPDMGSTSKIVSGGGHTYALVDGALLAAGKNSDGQLGINTNTSYDYFRSTLLSSGVTDMAIGQNHGYALTETNELYSTGNNLEGQLGRNGTTDQKLWAKIPSMDGTTAISSGGRHGLALKDGQLYSVGRNGEGQLGRNGTTNQSLWGVVSGMDGTTELKAGSVFSSVIKDGELYSSGYNTNGELGNGTFVQTTTFAMNPDISGFSNIIDGTFSSYSVYEGNLYSVGQGSFGILGLGEDTTDKNVFTELPGLVIPTGPTYPDVPDVTHVAQNPLSPNNMGFTHLSCFSSCYAVKNGNLYSVGKNSFGQLGREGEINQNTWGLVPGMSGGVTSAIATQNNAYAIKDGNLYSIGYNGSGQLSRDEFYNNETFGIVEGMDNVTYLASGGNYAYAIRGNELYSVGLNNNNQLGRPNTGQLGKAGAEAQRYFDIVPDTEGATKIYPTGFSTSEFAWLMKGSTTSELKSTGFSNIATENGITDFSTIGIYSFIIKNGKAYSKGDNQYSQLGRTGSTSEWIEIPNFSNPTDIAVVLRTSFVVNDGKLYGIGRNSQGQLGLGHSNVQSSWVQVNPTVFTNVTEIIEGFGSLHVVNNGIIYALGDNSYGQLGIGTNLDSMSPVALDPATIQN